MYSKEIPKNSTSLVVGMGLGDIDIFEILKEYDKPMVLDADMFYKKEIKELLYKEVILTPHPKEFSSLPGIIIAELIKAKKKG